MSNKLIKNHQDLKAYKKAFSAAMKIFEWSKKFPKQEKYSLTDQIRRSSRSVCANLAEAWRKRRYEDAFVAKLNDCEAEAAETQAWLDFALECQYLSSESGQKILAIYDEVLSILVKIINNPKPWLLKN
ncbi:MAG: four helix bundle protein [Xenococcaceae cyanobacterium]